MTCFAYTQTFHCILTFHLSTRSCPPLPGVTITSEPVVERQCSSAFSTINWASEMLSIFGCSTITPLNYALSLRADVRRGLAPCQRSRISLGLNSVAHVFDLGSSPNLHWRLINSDNVHGDYTVMTTAGKCGGLMPGFTGKSMRQSTARGCLLVQHWIVPTASIPFPVINQRQTDKMPLQVCMSALTVCGSKCSIFSISGLALLNTDMMPLMHLRLFMTKWQVCICK